MPFIETQDHAMLHYDDWGGSGAPVVLIHGWPLSAAMWEHQAYALAQRGLRVISYDRRGFGRSSHPWSGYDYDTLATDLSLVLEKLSLTGVTLVGFSMGGGEVVRYLARFGQERVARAALIGAVTPFLRQSEDNPDGIDAQVFHDMVAGVVEDRAHFLADFNKKFFGVGVLSHPVSQEHLDWSRHIALQASLKATVDCIYAFSNTDFRKEMAALTLPTLIVHGDEDETVPINISGRASARLVPHATFKVYEGAPHGLYATHAARLNEDLYDFASQPPHVSAR